MKAKNNEKVLSLVLCVLVVGGLCIVIIQQQEMSQNANPGVNKGLLEKTTAGDPESTSGTDVGNEQFTEATTLQRVSPTKKAGQQSVLTQPLKQSSGIKAPPNVSERPIAKASPHEVLQKRFEQVVPELLSRAQTNGQVDYKLFWQEFISWLNRQKDISSKTREQYRQALAVELEIR